MLSPGSASEENVLGGVALSRQKQDTETGRYSTVSVDEDGCDMYESGKEVQ